MAQIDRLYTPNRLLANMADADFARLYPHLERVELPRSFSLSVSGQISDYSYFIETGIASIVVGHGNGGKRTDIGLIGREGMSPTALVLNAPSAPFATVMQISGSGFRVLSSVLAHALNDSFTLRNLLTRYAQTVAVQTAFTAHVNATINIELRMARWILMCHDRIEDDTLTLTHEFLSVMLAVRRQSVTTALPILEGRLLIKAVRNRITVIDRAGLVAFAGTAYGAPEAEYQKLMGFR